MPAYDLRIEGTLKKLGLSYHIDQDGDFVLDWELSQGRTQRVFVRSETYDLGPMEVREVWSPVAYYPHIPAEKISRRLLERNALFKVGSFCYQKRKDGSYMVIFSARLSAQAPAHELEAVILAVAQTADQAEEELMGTDDF